MHVGHSYLRVRLDSQIIPVLFVKLRPLIQLSSDHPGKESKHNPS